MLDTGQIAAVEPALRHTPVRFADAIHDTSDATGDPQRFTIGLAEVCRRLGVQFHLVTSITGMATDGSTVTRIATPDGDIVSDIVVLAAGAASPLLTRTMGHRIPVSARLLADLIDGRRPDVDPTPYAPIFGRRHGT